MAVHGIHLIALLVFLSPTSPTPLILSPGRAPAGPFGFTEPTPREPVTPSAYPLDIVWQRALPREESYAFRQAERSTPFIRGQTVILGSSHAPGLFYFDLSSGALLKRLDTAGTVEAPVVPYPDSEDLVISDAGGFVTRIHSDGSKVWSHESIGPVVDRCFVAAGKVWYRAVDDSLVALDGARGEVLWTYRRPAQYIGGLEIFGAGVPALTPDGVLVAGFADGTVVGLDAENGSVRWERRIGQGDRWTDVDSDPVLLDGGRRVVAAAYSGPTVCLDTSTGEELWRADHVGYRGAALPRVHTLYLSTHDGRVVALDTQNGHHLWRFEVPGGAVASSPVWWRKHIVVTDSKGDIFVIDPVGGALRWRSRFDVRITGFSAPLAVGDDVLAGVSDGGWVYLFSADDFVPRPAGTGRGRWLEPWAVSRVPRVP